MSLIIDRYNQGKTGRFIRLVDKLQGSVTELLALYLNHLPPVQDASDVVFIDETGTPHDGLRVVLSTFCYLGDGSNFIDVSELVAGTLTADADYFDGVTWTTEPTALVDEIDQNLKLLVLKSGFAYKKIRVYDNGNLVGILVGESLLPNTALNTLGPPHPTIRALAGTSFFTQVSTVPYRLVWSDKNGYSPLNGIHIIPDPTKFNQNLGDDDQYLDEFQTPWRITTVDLKAQDPDTNPTGVTAGTINYYMENVSATSSIVFISQLSYGVNLQIDFEFIFGFLQLQIRDDTLDIQFNLLVKSQYAISNFTISSFVDTALKWHYMISGEHPTEGENYPDSVGITGATCADFRTLLLKAGITDVTTFVNAVKASKDDVVTNPALRSLTMVYFRDFDDFKGLGAQSFSIGVESLQPNLDLGFPGGYYATSMQKMAKLLSITFFAFGSAARDGFKTWTKVTEFKITPKGFSPAMVNSSLDALKEAPLKYPGKYPFDARVANALVADFPSGKLPSGKTVHLVENFWNPQPGWDAYQKGLSPPGVSARNNPEGEDLIRIDASVV